MTAFTREKLLSGWSRSIITSPTAAMLNEFMGMLHLVSQRTGQRQNVFPSTSPSNRGKAIRERPYVACERYFGQAKSRARVKRASETMDSLMDVSKIDTSTV